MNVIDVDQLMQGVRGIGPPRGSGDVWEPRRYAPDAGCSFEVSADVRAAPSRCHVRPWLCPRFGIALVAPSSGSDVTPIAVSSSRCMTEARGEQIAERVELAGTGSIVDVAAVAVAVCVAKTA